MKLKYLLIILALSIGKIALAQKQLKYIIPFKLTSYNNIAIRAIINHQDTVSLMFHTVANDITLTEEALKKITSIKFSRTDSVKSWGGDHNTSRYSENNTIQVGNLTLNNLPIWENKNSGQGTEGKFGLGLFENRIVEIDFDKNILIVHPSLPKKVKHYEKLNLTYNNDQIFIEATAKIGDKSYKNNFLIHSGYGGDILFDDKFIAENKLADQLKVIDEKQLKDSFGNILKTKKAILSSLTFGQNELLNVPVGFFEGAIGRQKTSIIGGDVLKRFNIILDAKRTSIYLKSNHLKNTKYSNI